MRAPEPSGNADANSSERAVDTMIKELIAKRKLQQEALSKIKASVEKNQSAGSKNPRSRSKK